MASMANKHSTRAQNQHKPGKRERAQQPDRQPTPTPSATPQAIQRAIEQPGPETLTRAVVRSLQHSHGNHFVQSLARRASFPIQAKLEVTPANDPYEQEADQTAAEVVASLNSDVQRQDEDEEVMAQRTPDSVAGGPVSEDVESAIKSARGGGSPLPDQVRDPMEQAFGADFSGVRVHTGAQADSLNRSIHARAFTTGSDIFFKQGEYQPNNTAGQTLLAHELTHTIQQGGVRRQEEEEEVMAQRQEDEEEVMTQRDDKPRKS